MQIHSAVCGRTVSPSSSHTHQDCTVFCHFFSRQATVQSLKICSKTDSFIDAYFVFYSSCFPFHVIQDMSSLYVNFLAMKLILHPLIITRYAYMTLLYQVTLFWHVTHKNGQ